MFFYFHSLLHKKHIIEFFMKSYIEKVKKKRYFTNWSFFPTSITNQGLLFHKKRKPDNVASLKSKIFYFCSHRKKRKKRTY